MATEQMDIKTSSDNQQKITIFFFSSFEDFNEFAI